MSETELQLPPSFFDAEAARPLIECVQTGGFFDVTVAGNPRTIGTEVFSLQYLDDANFQAQRRQAEMLGYEITKSDSGWHLKLPIPEALNETRQKRLKGLGATTADFVLHNGGYIEPREYLTYIVNHQIPIARDPLYLHHDYFHALGFSKLSGEVFGIFQSVAADALQSENKHRITGVASKIDDLSGDAAAGAYSLNIPENYFSGIFPGIKKKLVEKRQRALFERVALLAK